LFAYCVFAILGSIYYPRRLFFTSGGQDYGIEQFNRFVDYIFLSFVMIALFYLLSRKIVPNFKVVLVKKQRGSLFLFNTIIYIYILVIGLYLFRNYSSLSYLQQSVLKGKKIWFYSYSASGVIILSLIVSILSVNRRVQKNHQILLLLLVIFIQLLTSFRSGQRSEILAWVNAVVIFTLSEPDLERKNRSIRNNKKKHKLKLFGLILLIILLFQIIRSTRGSFIDDISIDIRAILNSLFSAEVIIFQDWVLPPLTLLTAMNYKLIDPIFILKSNAINLFSFFWGSVLSPGGKLSRFIDPSGVKGYGYHILTEGYQIAGWGGIIVSAVSLVFFYKAYQVLFITANNKLYNKYVNGLLAFFIINIIRNSGLFFLKGIYFYVVPGIILYGIFLGYWPKIMKR